MRSSLALLGCLAALTGCQHLVYQPPAVSTPTATFTFSSNNVAVQPVVCVPGIGFRDTEFAVAQEPFSSELVSELNASLKKSKTVSVPVDATRGRVIAGFVMQQKTAGGSRKRCRVAASIPVIAEQEYAVQFVHGNGHCGIEVRDAQQTTLADVIIVPWQCP